MVSGFLDNDQLRRLAPSVFADRAHDSRSSRYQYIPTARIVDALRGEGFQPVKITTARVRDEGRHGFEQHMIRFRQQDAIATVGQVLPEIVLVNSHDGSTSYNIMAGLFRLICSNGLVVPHGNLSAECRIRHTGENVVDDVIEGSFTVLKDSALAIQTAEQWQQIELKPSEQTALAIGAHHLRFADAEGNVDTAIQPDQFLRPRRYDDQKTDLWTTFNRIQENAIKGGLTAVGRDATGRRRRTTTREVKGIDGNVNLNKALWKMAEHMAKTVG